MQNNKPAQKRLPDPITVPPRLLTPKKTKENEEKLRNYLKKVRAGNPITHKPGNI